MLSKIIDDTKYQIWHTKGQLEAHKEFDCEEANCNHDGLPEIIKRLEFILDYYESQV